MTIFVQVGKPTARKAMMEVPEESEEISKCPAYTTTTLKCDTPPHWETHIKREADSTADLPEYQSSEMMHPSINFIKKRIAQVCYFHH